MQARMFGSEDLPLFSGTPQRANVDAFAPESEGRQGTLDGMCEHCAGAGLLGEWAFCSCVSGRRKLMCREIVTLSDGTIGTLTGLSRYDDIEAARAEWIEWVKGQPETVVIAWDSNWHPCWNDYEETQNA